MNRSLAVFFTFLLASSVFAQAPDSIQRYRSDSLGATKYQLEGILAGNNIRTIYFNTSEVAHWPDTPNMEWPKGSGHNYLDGLTILIGAKIHLASGLVITPIEAHYREEYDYDPAFGNQYPWDLEPLPGYASTAVTTPAISSSPSTWPSSWPTALNLPDDYNGQWYSVLGKGVQEKLVESFFVVDDSKDAEFQKSPYNYYPIASDSNRGGLGLRVEGRSMQWNYPLLKDIIFWEYRIVNISDYNYDTTGFGLFYDPGVGSYQNSTPDNSTNFDTALNMSYSWAEGGVGYPDNYATGYMGIALLKTPGNLGLTNGKNWVLGDKSATGIWPKNDGVVWGVMTGGLITDGVNNANIGSLMATGPFSFPKWTADTISYAMIAAADLPQLKAKSLIANKFSRNGYRIPDSFTRFGDFEVQILTPAGDSHVSGTTDITWKTTGNVGKTTVYLFFCRHDTDWVTIGMDTSNSGHFSWSTTTTKDGIFYKLRVVCSADNGMAFAESESTFTVNNPGNVPPDVMFLAPDSNAVLSGNTTIQWRAGDADGDTTRIALYALVPAISDTWSLIVSGLPSDVGSYVWDTHGTNNGSAYIRAVATSGSDSATAITGPVTLQNDRTVVQNDQLGITRKGRGTGAMEVHVVDLPSATGDSYVVQFDTLSTSDTVVYNVFNQRTGCEVVTAARIGDLRTEGPTFEGLRLAITNDSTAVIDSTSGWVVDSNDVILKVQRDHLSPGHSLTMPADYRIDWFDTGADTSILYGTRFPSIVVPFRIMNQTDSSHVVLLLDDADLSGTLSSGDTIRFMEHYVSHAQFNLTWQMTYAIRSVTTPVLPSAGDEYIIHTSKPFESGDSISFSTATVVGVSAQANTLPTAVRLFQNYPNPFNPSTTVAFDLPRKSLVVVTIFDLLGREVRTLVNGSLEAGSYRLPWDGRNRSGKVLPSGVYFCSLRASGVVQTRKMVILR